MVVIKGNNIPEGSLSGACISIGVFDGVHIGHRAILERLIDVSKRLTAPSLVITMHPDPVKVLNPEVSFTILTPLSRKVLYLEELGIEYCFILQLDRNLLSLSALEFFQKFIVHKFSPRAIVVGKDFRFGRDREGNIELLKELSHKFGFQLYALPLLNMENEKVSSSKIREYLMAGKIYEAKILLGRAPEISGKVVPGEGRGRILGYPTANLLPDFEFYLKPGVYAGKVTVSEENRPALLYVGTAPTFGGKVLRYEIYIPEFHGNLYGKNVIFFIEEIIRDEKKFKSREEIIRQLSADKENLIRYFRFITRV
jgi:riboflavin kinase/FMN adenylyltransferase